MRNRINSIHVHIFHCPALSKTEQVECRRHGWCVFFAAAGERESEIDLGELLHDGGVTVLVITRPHRSERRADSSSYATPKGVSSSRSDISEPDRRVGLSLSGLGRECRRSLSMILNRVDDTYCAIAARLDDDCFESSLASASVETHAHPLASATKIMTSSIRGIACVRVVSSRKVSQSLLLLAGHWWNVFFLGRDAIAAATSQITTLIV